MGSRGSETIAAPPVLGVVQVHVEEAAALRRQRTRLVSAPHIRLHLLARHDERIAAHLDGIAVAGSAGSELVHAAAPQPGGGETFASAASALVDEDHATIRRLVAFAEQSPDAMRGVVSAFGWVSAPYLRGITKDLLASNEPHARSVGLAACAMHDVDPGPVLGDALDHPHAMLAGYALDVAAQLGRAPRCDACAARLDGSAGSLRFRAARAALLLGERSRSLAALHELAALPGALGDEALALLLHALEQTPAHELLQALARRPEAMRRLVRGAGLSGQAQYAPWLVRQCAEPALARLAGEALAMITGLDLDAAGLLAQRPDDVGHGDAADDPALDEDEDLPWPDAPKLATWWQANGARFGSGTRWFVGAPLSPTQCLRVLRDGQQRQRRAAALRRALLAPGTPVFNVAAPAWRQRRRLATL